MITGGAVDLQTVRRRENELGYDPSMSSIDEIEQAVRDLPTEDLREFRRWFLEFDAQLWDRQIERDAAEGKLDRLGDEALEELRQGRTRPL